MVDLKQLKYFVVSADVSSFSEAAKVLYTTQSNISKAIASMEKSMGVRLFRRESRGISLTAQGRNVYRYACRILDEMENLERIGNAAQQDWLNISGNPSTWLARRFSEYYRAHYSENLHCHFRVASVGEIFERVCNGLDEIGFIYIINKNLERFSYELDHNGLEFEELTRTDAMLFLGKEHLHHDDMVLTQQDVDELRYIQMYDDEFTDRQLWTLGNEQESKIRDMDVCIVTNSDHVMEMILNHTPLANISGGYLSRHHSLNIRTGIPLTQEDSRVIYGIVKRAGETLSIQAEDFVNHLRESLEKADD